MAQPATTAATNTSTTKPTIVLTHGIWHSPLTYSKFTSALRAAGYDVHVPFLPSCTGARPPKASLPEDTQLVRRLVEMLCDQGRTVIMVMHSYGGVVGCNALKGLGAKKGGGVAHLVAVAAHLHPVGFGILDLVREMGNKDLIPVAFDIAPDGSCMSKNVRASLFNDLANEAEANALMRTLSRANLDCMEAKVQFEAWKHIPLTYVHTTADMTLPPHYQKRILEKMEKAKVKAKVVEMDSGHSPYVTKTDELVALVEKVAAHP
ncbi:hypothetical protein EPUS_06512 [Endocarpon pusillum Z07020]|uniref:AB hydrolase-1 domain-containing protein n=1 Tax=Endocarpon pusillum (strain Z07020 / HMAS-L-300199) TaxID=1263415 RepID=U1GII7_ENDPU|nr:uncharacterized protein EPUS_06512 [Endocarpon pusillum Z07020]ERF71953.1 hypothetical protein EPUS_06512 [Endocarpon pusillum Z07020]